MAAFLDAVASWLPASADFVVLGGMALSAGVVYAVSFFGTVGSHYRTANPLLPPTLALAACLMMMAPVASLVIPLGLLGQKHGVYLFAGPFSTARVLACLCGVPLALWLPAVALTSWPAFRNTHMPAPPEEAASQGGAAPEPSSGAVGAAAEPVGGEAEVAVHPAGSKKED